VITDYTSLKAAIADFSHRSDLTNYLDDFIQLAEERISSVLKVSEMEASETGTLSSITLALPADFADLRSLTITDTYKHCPLYLGADGISSKYDPTSGMPNYYAIIGSNIQFNRPPNAYTYKLDYWQNPPAITNTNTTSTVLTNYTGVYLYGCLVEVAWYTKNDADIQRYTTKFNELVDISNKRGRAQGGPMRIVNG
jgi:hypothetical protein